MGAAREGEVVDVGVVGGAPAGDVMDLGVVGRGGAPGVGAAAFLAFIFG